MKKKLLKLSLLCSLFLFSCNNSLPYPTYEDLSFENNDTSIYIASDTHYLASSYLDSNRDYDGELFVTDGRTMNYNNILFDKLIEQTIIDSPDYFIITGDITYNGEYNSHLEVANKLDKLLAKGIQPLVIPGNHDTFSLSPRDYSNNEYNIVKSTTSDEFKQIYQNFGYSNGFSYDKDTLSYTYITKNNEMLLMLDSTYSRYNYEDSYSYISGGITCIDWLINNLEYAKENNLKVISFMHHSLITHNKLFERLYTITNSEQILDLYKKYNVEINFSGHLHIQDIMENNGIYDICSNSLLDYGNRYGIFKIGKNGMQYDSKYIDFILDNKSYHEYSFNLFKKMYMLKSRFETVNEQNNEILKEFLGRFNAYYFDGSIFLHQELKKEKGYSLLKEYGDNEYSTSLFNSFNKNNYKLVIKD